MRAATSLVAFGLTRLLETSTFRQVARSRPTLVTSTSLCLTFGTRRTLTNSRMLFITSHSRVRFAMIESLDAFTDAMIMAGDDEYDFWKAEASKAMKQRMGLSVNPLDESIQRVSLMCDCLETHQQPCNTDQQAPIDVPILP